MGETIAIVGGAWLVLSLPASVCMGVLLRRRAG
jgi:hypothetical protein